MANNLTGDYEAVLQVSVRQINGLLATLRQKGARPSREARRGLRVRVDVQADDRRPVSEVRPA